MVTTRGVSREHVSKLVSPVTGSGFTAVESQLPQDERAPISTSLLRLHNQDLIDVMFEIEKCENPCAQSVFNLALGGHIHSLDESALKELRKERIGIFKPSEWDSPILAGMEQFPFASVPPVAQIQSIVTYDMEDQNSFRFAPSRGSPEQDTHAAVKLLNNIGNSVYCEPGAIIHMQSPTLDLLRSSSPNWNTDGFLGQSNFQVTIAPANEVFELEYYAHYFLSTLLVGSKVWLAFPPLHGNLTILRQAYEDMQTKDSIQVSLHVLKILQHGIAIIQKPGETITIPPFWSIMAFCNETSTSCSCFIATASDFMDRVRNMDLWPAVNRLWNMKAQEQAQHVRYATEFANHLKAILQNSFDHFKADRVISELCRAWMSNTQDDPSEENTESDTPMVDIQGWALVPSTLCGNLADSGWKDIKVRSLKEKVAGLCAAIEDQAQKERVQQIFQQAWIEFLEKKRKKKAECRLCHLRIDCMPGEGSSSQILAQHFVTAHWSS